ncbi:MAG TPA: MATE family efflux transporter [Acidimicrobiia bacterium]|nr:MATE family efflux transporter [Acidimicrobiia bacterium]
MTARLGPADREILGLALPALGALAIDPLLTLADTAFVATLGTVELAALGVDTAIFGFAFFAFNFLAYVVTPLVARALGQGRVEEARRWVGDALVLALTLGLLVSVALELAAPLLVDLMGATPDVADPAVGYLRIRALATPAVLVVTAGHGAFRGHKDTRTPLKVALGVNLLNLVLDPLMIFGLGWGLEGAAIATVIAQYLGAAWFIRLMVAREMASRPRGLTEALPSLLDLGRNGALLTMRTGLLLGSFTIAAAVATRLGPEEIAAHQLVAQVFLLTALLADSFAIAAQAMVGETAARGEMETLDALNRRLVGWGAVAGLILMLGVAVGRFGLGAITGDAVVADLAIGAGGVVALIEPVAAVLFVADGIFLGLLALGTMVVSTGLGAVVAVGLMLATPLGDTLNGIWWALAVMLVVRGVVLLIGYRRSAETALKS